MRFDTGGLDEMCWRLITWGEGVTVEEPVRLRRWLARMCKSLVAHHSALYEMCFEKRQFK